MVDEKRVGFMTNTSKSNSEGAKKAKPKALKRSESYYYQKVEEIAQSTWQKINDNLVLKIFSGVLVAFAVVGFVGFVRSFFHQSWLEKELEFCSKKLELTKDEDEQNIQKIHCLKIEEEILNSLKTNAAAVRKLLSGEVIQLAELSGLLGCFTYMVNSYISWKNSKNHHASSDQGQETSAYLVAASVPLVESSNSAASSNEPLLIVGSQLSLDETFTQFQEANKEASFVGVGDTGCCFWVCYAKPI